MDPLTRHLQAAAGYLELRRPLEANEEIGLQPAQKFACVGVGLGESKCALPVMRCR